MQSRILSAVILTALSLPLQATEQSWATWLMNTVERHPVMQAYDYEQRAAQFSAAAAAKPLYNPSLDTTLEREGNETNFQVGVSSEIDWWNVSGKLTEAGRLQAEQSRLQVSVATNDLLAEILTAQVAAQVGRQAYQLAQLQVEQDLTLLKLTEEQLAAGEVNRTELAMAKAVVAQGMVAENERLSQWLAARKTLRALAGEQADETVINKAFWQRELVVPASQQLLTLPWIKQARIDWLMAVAQADAQQAATKPVPSLGLGVGRQAGESLVALNLSVPLQWRNDFSEGVSASRELALASEQRLQARLIDTREAVANLAERLQQIRRRYQQWQQLHDNEIAEQVAVLQHRYAQGDLALSDYQWQVQQLRDGLQAGLTLQSQFQLTYIAFLHITATLVQQVSSLSSEQ